MNNKVSDEELERLLEFYNKDHEFTDVHLALQELKELRASKRENTLVEKRKKHKTCTYKGCPDPYTMKAPCALCYE